MPAGRRFYGVVKVRSAPLTQVIEPAIEGQNLLSLDDIQDELARMNEASASHMLFVLLMVAWALATLVILSGLFGFGSVLSLYLAVGWWALTGGILLFWKRLNSAGKKWLCLLILGLLIARWGYSWLVSSSQDAIIGLVIGLLYTPILMMIATILFSGRSLLVCISVGAIMGAIAMLGSTREVLAVSHLDDWRIGPVVFFVYSLYAWLLSNWIREREQLRTTTEQAAGLAVAANTDALTQVYNRRAADQFIERHASSGRRYGVIFIDLDHFKSINDSQGHDVGDRVLQQVSQVLRLRTREADFVARWGGEEFIVILVGVSREQAAAIGEHLRSHIEKDAVPGLPSVTASLGIAYAPSGASLPGAILRADEAVYRAKTGGRNQVVIDDASV